MANRHYVLLATDGYVQLPNTADYCPAPETLRQVYIFGFAGGLYKVDEQIVNPVLDWAKPENWPIMQAMATTATIPSPMIWCDVGDHLYITLINLGMPVADITDLHTVHMHGAHVATQVDGFPETSFGVPMWMDFTAPPPVITYYFESELPGTLMYHCHVEASEHIQMGMYGALIIYPSMKSLREAGIRKNKMGRWILNGVNQYQIPKTATHRNFAYNDIQTYFDKDYVMLLSDIDTVWHDTVQVGGTFLAPDFKPNFWLVNGRSFPDTLLPHPQTPQEGSDPNLTQITYESYVHVMTGQKFLLRMINMGYQVVPWHIHGWHFAVVGKDSNPSPNLKIGAMLQEMAKKHEVFVPNDWWIGSMDKVSNMSGSMNHGYLQMGFTATIGSGETYDLLITAEDKRNQYRNYIVNGQDGIPSLCSQMDALKATDPASIANIPIQPMICPAPDYVNYVDICEGKQGSDRFFPQFYPMHNHDDYKVTNNGVYPGGQLTFLQTDAP